MELDVEALKKELVMLGYERTGQVEGQDSLRCAAVSLIFIR